MRNEDNDLKSKLLNSIAENAFIASIFLLIGIVTSLYYAKLSIDILLSIILALLGFLVPYIIQLIVDITLIKENIKEVKSLLNVKIDYLKAKIVLEEFEHKNIRSIFDSKLQKTIREPLHIFKMNGEFQYNLEEIPMLLKELLHKTESYYITLNFLPKEDFDRIFSNILTKVQKDIAASTDRLILRINVSSDFTKFDYNPVDSVPTFEIKSDDINNFLIELSKNVGAHDITLVDDSVVLLSSSRPQNTQLSYAFLSINKEKILKSKKAFQELLEYIYEELDTKCPSMEENRKDEAKMCINKTMHRLKNGG